MKKLYVFFLLVCLPISVFAQKSKVDSLESLLAKRPQADTTRINLLIEIANNTYSTDIEKSYRYAIEADSLSEKVVYLKGKATSQRLIGIRYLFKSDYPKSLKYFQNSLQFYEKIGDKKGVAGAHNNQGVVYWKQGNNPKAVEQYQKALKLEEELGNKDGIGRAYINIGNIYQIQKDSTKAINYYQKALQLFKKLNIPNNVAICLNNLGNINAKGGNYSKAIEYYQKALKIFEKSGYQRRVATCYRNIGNNHNNLKAYTKAIDYYQKALELATTIGEKQIIAGANAGLGDVYLKTGKLQRAKYHAQKGYDMADEIGNVTEVNFSAEILAKVYNKTGEYQKAYNYHVIFKTSADSLVNEENIQKVTDLEYQYKYEKEKQALKLEQQRKDSIKAAEAKRQKTIRNSLIIGFIFMIILAGVIFRNLLQKRKANQMLSEQKGIIEQTNEELKVTLETISQQKEELSSKHQIVSMQNEQITSSINYASRIQNAVLPSQKLREEILPEHFILFKPRDIVSGDFFWTQKIKHYLVVAAVDCTGHGVPGAFMSMLGVSFLNDIIKQEKMIQASQILEDMRTRVKETLDQTGKIEESTDGMDMALYIIDTETNTLQFSGANNPLYLFRDKQLIEYKANRQPVGINLKETPFVNHEIELQSGDNIYTFSDGYVDQFGGTKGGKFLSKQFKKTLTDIQGNNMLKQKEILEQTFENWRGEMEQIDDVLVIGLKI